MRGDGAAGYIVTMKPAHLEKIVLRLILDFEAHGRGPETTAGLLWRYICDKVEAVQDVEVTRPLKALEKRGLVDSRDHSLFWLTDAGRAVAVTLDARKLSRPSLIERLRRAGRFVGKKTLIFLGLAAASLATLLTKDLSAWIRETIKHIVAD